MKEPVTQFDLNAAFKALEEIPVPVAEKGIAANRLDLNEALKRVSKTDLLVEDYYNVRNPEELQEAADEREAEIAKAKLARIEKIVDLEAESEEDLLPSYEGKVIIQCPQCMTLFYKNPEDIETTEEADDVVNINEVCQHCGNASGYNVIGKVAGIDEDEAANYAAAEDLTTDSDEDLNELDLDFDLDEAEVEDEEAIDEAETTTEEEELEEEEEEEEVEESLKPESSSIPLNEEISSEESEAIAVDEPTKEIESTNETAEEAESEPLTEEADVSDEEFKELISSPEFKSGISEAEVDGYLESLNEALEPEELEEGIKDFLAGVKSSIKDKVKFKGNTLNDRAIAVAAELLQKTPEEAADGEYSFYVIPYKRGGKGTPVRNYTALSETNPKVYRFGIDSYEKAAATALSLSGRKDTDICEVDVVLAKSDTPKSDFIYKDNKKDNNGSLVPVTAHPNTFAAYVEGKNYVNTDVDARFINYTKNQELRDKEAKATENASVVEDEPNKEQNQSVDSAKQATEKAEKQSKTDTTENNQTVPEDSGTSAKKEKAPVTVTPVKDKYNLVYGTKKNQKLVILPDDLTSQAETIALGKSLGKATAILITPDGKKLKFKDGQKVTDGTYTDGQNVFEAYMSTLEDLDESRLETYLTESLTNVYENIDTFKVTNCSLDNKNLIIEGDITFKSGNVSKTIYKFNEAIYNEDEHKLTLIGLNERFKNSQFKVTGLLEDNKTLFLAEQVNYVYEVDDTLIEGFTGKPKTKNN